MSYETWIHFQGKGRGLLIESVQYVRDCIKWGLFKNNQTFDVIRQRVVDNRPFVYTDNNVKHSSTGNVWMIFTDAEVTATKQFIQAKTTDGFTFKIHFDATANIGVKLEVQFNVCRTVVKGAWKASLNEIKCYQNGKDVFPSANISISDLNKLQLYQITFKK